jgi:hypothetical protein
MRLILDKKQASGKFSHTVNSKMKESLSDSYLEAASSDSSMQKAVATSVWMMMKN